MDAGIHDAARSSARPCSKARHSSSSSPTCSKASGGLSPRPAQVALLAVWHFPVKAKIERWIDEQREAVRNSQRLRVTSASFARFQYWIRSIRVTMSTTLPRASPARRCCPPAAADTPRRGACATSSCGSGRAMISPTVHRVRDRCGRAGRGPASLPGRCRPACRLSSTGSCEMPADLHQFDRRRRPSPRA